MTLKSSLHASLLLTLVLANTSLASDLKLDGQAHTSKPLARNLQITLTGNPGLPTLLAVDVSAGPTSLFGESLAIGMTPAMTFLPLPGTDATGVAKVNLVLPSSSLFIGTTFHALGVVFDPADPNGLDFSSGASITLTDGDMALIPTGTFMMGDHNGWGTADELPTHPVDIYSFYMDVYETSNAEFVVFLNSALSLASITVTNGTVYSAGTNGKPYCDTNQATPECRIQWDGSAFSVAPGKGDHPMNKVSWFGSAAFANWRSGLDALLPCYDQTTWTCNFAATGYRLATEAEWEYAARGNMKTPYTRFPWGPFIGGSNANFIKSGDDYEQGPTQHTTPVGYYDGAQLPVGVDMANDFGLYDMSGNVWEWCGDFYGQDFYAVSPILNPQGPSTGGKRVIRGGNYSATTIDLRSANRSYSHPALRYFGIGFRLVRTAP